MSDFSFPCEWINEPEHIQPVHPPSLLQAVVLCSPPEKLSEIALYLLHFVSVEKEFEQGIGQARGAVRRCFFGRLHIL
jgi:hypothetical protein